MNVFGVVEITDHIWKNIYPKPIYCIGVIDENDISEIEPFSDDYLAEVAEIDFEDFVYEIENSVGSDMSKVLTYQYISDNGWHRSTDTYFIDKESAQNMADFLNG